MRLAWILSGCVLVLGIAVLALGGVGHNDEVSYTAQGEALPGRAVGINIQNTGSFRRYLGLFGLRRYGPPYELYIDVRVPPGVDGVELREVEVLDGGRRILSVGRASLRVETATVLRGGETTHENLASYRHPATLGLSSEVATVSGTFSYETAGGPVDLRFRQEFRRDHERGFFTDL